MEKLQELIKVFSSKVAQNHIQYKVILLVQGHCGGRMLTVQLKYPRNYSQHGLHYMQHKVHNMLLILLTLHQVTSFELTNSEYLYLSSTIISPFRFVLFSNDHSGTISGRRKKKSLEKYKPRLNATLSNFPSSEYVYIQFEFYKKRSHNKIK